MAIINLLKLMDRKNESSPDKSWAKSTDLCADGHARLPETLVNQAVGFKNWEVPIKTGREVARHTYSQDSLPANNVTLHVQQDWPEGSFFKKMFGELLTPTTRKHNNSALDLCSR